MTTMFHDVHGKTDKKLEKQRVPGASFDEVTYADDTICIATCTKTLNVFIKNIEIEGMRYGMKLNKEKCELITTHEQENVHFGNKTQINIVKRATYLGCEMGIQTTNREELNKRFANTMVTMKKLDLFWRHSDCDIAVKIHTADAVLRTKLLYGLESSQLLPSALKRLETFQLKVLRKILKVDTTFINRGNTNSKVFKLANDKLKETIHKNKTIVTFIESYKKLKRKRAFKIINQPEQPIYKITFQGNRLGCWVHPNRRVGRPRLNWTEETIKEIWETLRAENTKFKYKEFNGEDDDIINHIKKQAREQTTTPDTI